MPSIRVAKKERKRFGTDCEPEGSTRSGAGTVGPPVARCASNRRPKEGVWRSPGPRCLVGPTEVTRLRGTKGDRRSEERCARGAGGTNRSRSSSERFERHPVGLGNLVKPWHRSTSSCNRQTFPRSPAISEIVAEPNRSAPITATERSLPSSTESIVVSARKVSGWTMVVGGIGRRVSDGAALPSGSGRRDG